MLARPADYKPTDYKAIDWDVFASPSWRWERVLELVDRPGAIGRVTRRDDKWIRLGKTFLVQWRKGSDNVRKELTAKLPGMACAYKMFDSQDSDPNKKFCLEARILARQSNEEIANEEHTFVESVNCYEKLFFDVRPKIDSLDWILTSVLVPAADRFADNVDEDDADTMFRTPVVVKAHFDSTLKFLAYFGQSVLVDVALTGFRRGIIPRRQDDIADWFNESIGHMIGKRTLQAVQVFDVNKYNVPDLINAHNQIVAIAKSAEIEENKHTAIEKAVNAMLTEIPWTVGKHAKEVYSGTLIGEYDEMSAELRDDEIMKLTSGDTGELNQVLEEVPGLKMPRLREVSSKEAKKNDDSNTNS